MRSHLITIRVTEATHKRLKLQAATHGLTLSGLAEQLVRKGRVVVIGGSRDALDPAVLAELKRLGNNLNQLAHAANAGLPPSIPAAARRMHGLLTLLVRHHYFSSRLEAARATEAANDSSAPQAREEFQRNAELRPARPQEPE